MKTVGVSIEGLRYDMLPTSPPHYPQVGLSGVYTVYCLFVMSEGKGPSGRVMNISHRLYRNEYTTFR